MVLLMIILVALPVISITLISTLTSRSSSISQIEELNDAQASVIEESIETIVAQNMHTLCAFANSPATISYLSGHIEADAEKHLLDYISRINDDFKDDNAIALSGTDGMQKLRSDNEAPVDISDREYFKAAISGSQYVSDIQISKSSGKRIATLACPVRDFGGNIIGIVQRNYNLSALHDLLASEITEDRHEIVIVDSTGSVVAHSGHEIDPDNPEDQSGNPFYTESRGDTARGSYETKWEGDTWMVSWIKEQTSGWVVASCRVQSVVLKSINQATIILVILGIIFLVVFGVVAFFIARSLTSPIAEINNSLSSLAVGSFDEIHRFENRKDEFGDIVRETNFVINKIRDIVNGIKASATSVNESSEHLADMTMQINETSNDVSNAVEEIAGGATHQASEIQVAVEHTSTISKNIQQVTDNAESVARTTDEMSTNSRNSRKQLERLQTSSVKMSDAINEITDRISATEAAVERINNKVEAINSIASQTNLLALNASIEAARAGESGRGFAVVADEIGNLADESAKSANEIRAEMDALLQQSQSAVEVAKKVNEIAEVEQKSIIDDTVNSIGSLINEIEKTIEGINSITTSAHNCETSKDEVSNSMSSLSAISEENAAASEETAASMEELGAIVSSLADDAQSLKEISHSLIEAMAFFKD
jgi:methyl-accepting chemotaxis protein